MYLSTFLDWGLLSNCSREHPLYLQLLIGNAERVPLVAISAPKAQPVIDFYFFLSRNKTNLSTAPLKVSGPCI